MSSRFCTHKAAGDVNLQTSCSCWESAQISAPPLHVVDLLVCACSQSSYRQSHVWCEHTKNEAAVVGQCPSFMCALTMGLLWWTSAPSCAHPQLQPGPHSRSFGLSPCIQTESFLWVCLLKPELQHPAARPRRQVYVSAGKCSKGARTVCAGVSLFCLRQASWCTPLQASEAPCLSRLISQLVKRVPSVREPFLLHSSFPQAQVPPQFLLFNPFHSTWLQRSFLQLWLHEILWQLSVDTL